jgi:hydroxymethylglutaryl-CoA lyase
MQGLAHFIPTTDKIRYLQKLLAVGFDVLDCGSFVSPKAIPQMRDTAEVLAALDLGNPATATQLLTIVANQRGAEQALSFPQISFLGYPLSVSETFQQRNTNRSIADALADVAAIQQGCQETGKTLVVYLSMGFGNPYGDPYSPALVAQLAEKLADLGVHIISLADTVGSAVPKDIRELFETLIPQYPHISFGAHLHSTPEATLDKVIAAYEAGCRRFDGALRGFGGCPMAKDDLVGNVATERMLPYFEQKGAVLTIDPDALNEAMLMSAALMP